MATGRRGGVEEMLESVEDNNVSIAKLCNRARPDSGALLGEEVPSTEDMEENDLRGVLGAPSSCEADLQRDVILLSLSFSLSLLVCVWREDLTPSLESRIY